MSCWLLFNSHKKGTQMEKNITYIKLSLDYKLLVFPPYMIFRHCFERLFSNWEARFDGRTVVWCCKVGHWSIQCYHGPLIVIDIEIHILDLNGSRYGCQTRLITYNCYTLLIRKGNETRLILTRYVLTGLWQVTHLSKLSFLASLFHAA